LASLRSISHSGRRRQGELIEDVIACHLPSQPDRARMVEQVVAVDGEL